MKKRITMLLTNGFDPDVRVYKEALYLVGRGFEVTILCWYRDASRNYPLKEYTDGINVIRFDIPAIAGSGKKQLAAFLKYIHTCRDYLKVHPCDYLHCNDIDGAITGYIARRRGTPMVFDMHEFYERGNSFERTIWRKLTLFFLKRSIAGLYENAAYTGSGYKSIRERLFPLRNYSDASLIVSLPKSESSVFRIGYHGAVRGQISEFTALFEAVKGMLDVRVDINGGGPDGVKLTELVSHYTNVYYHGLYNGATESSDLYAKTDALFCGYDPSNPNYQGDAEVVKFYEAIFTGTPMIMTESIGMGEKVRNYCFGLTCDTRDSNAIRLSILHLKDDHEFWQQCANNEKAQAHLYNWQEAVRILDRIYA